MVLLQCDSCEQLFTSGEVSIHQVFKYYIQVKCPKCEYPKFIQFNDKGKSLI
jgi:phage FluMu protein Com